MSRGRTSLLAWAATAALLATSCKSSAPRPPGPRVVTEGERYESVVQIVNRTIVEVDRKTKTPTQVDVELEWDPCPGQQYQMVRGGAEFAKCTEKFKPGDYVGVIALHFWDPRGYYRYDVEKLGDCKRPVEDRTPGSYEKGQECHDIHHYGRKAGFSCSRLPKRQLIARCPWMKRD
jgi:hypothetical protein